MLLLLLTPTITTRTSQFHKFFWLLFLLICFPIQNSLCSENGPPLNNEESTDTVNDIDELRRQMIIITSILGGVVVLTLMLVLALAVSISKMKAKFSNKHERYLASTPDTGAAISPSIRQNRQQEIHAYDNSAFNSGGSSGHEMEERRVDSKSEVERLGYEMYNGKHENRKNTYQRQSDRFLIRYTEDDDVIKNGSRPDGVEPRPSATPKYDEYMAHKQKTNRYTAQLPRASTLSGSTPSHQLRMDEGVAPMSQATPTRENYNRRSGSDERAYRY